MAETRTLTLTSLANGGAAIGRDQSGRVFFVPFAIPGEQVQVEIVRDKGRYLDARLSAVVKASPDRVTPRCPHFTVCGNCHLQHIDYSRQVALKAEVLADQLARIGRVSGVHIEPVIAHPQPWEYRRDAALSPAYDGGLGYWSPVEGRVIPITTCEVIDPALRDLLADIDLELPGLRRLTLRMGDDEQRLLAFEIDDVEAPQLEVDLPVSATIILPDRTTANLIGDNFVLRRLGGRDFQVTAGCAAPPSPVQAEALLAATLRYAALTGAERVLELYGGVGFLTAFLAAGAAAVAMFEGHEDALADAVVNLDDTENVSLYAGDPRLLLPAAELTADVGVVTAPAGGLAPVLIAALRRRLRRRLVYIGDDVALLARDARALQKQGFRLTTVQPIDMTPHAYTLWTVSLFELP